MMRGRLIVLSAIAFAAVAVASAWVWTTGMGRARALAMVEDIGCAPGPQCDRSAREVIEVMAAAFELPVPLTEWCLGVVHWDRGGSGTLGPLKPALVWLMARPCGPMIPGQTMV